MSPKEREEGFRKPQNDNSIREQREREERERERLDKIIKEDHHDRDRNKPAHER
jgi:hypothetical protein